MPTPVVGSSTGTTSGAGAGAGAASGAGASSFGGAFFSSFSWWHLFSTTLRIGRVVVLVVLGLSGGEPGLGRRALIGVRDGERRGALGKCPIFTVGDGARAGGDRLRMTRGRMRLGHGRDSIGVPGTDRQCRATGGEHDGVVVLCRDGLDRDRCPEARRSGPLRRRSWPR